MKLSWKDLVTTLFALLGGAVVYAKFNDYAWTLLDSWRMAVVTLAVAGIGMFAFSSFNFSNMSWLNIGEMTFGLVAIVLSIAGIIFASSTVFYSLAIILGALWLVDTIKHARHSLIDSSTSYHHQVPVH